MAVLYITSDRPAAGKTALTSALAVQLSAAGRRVGYFKPYSSEPEGDADVDFIARSVLPTGDNGVPPGPLPLPEAGLESQQTLHDTVGQIQRSMEQLAAANDLVIVEGPSLSSSEGDRLSSSVELAEVLGAAVVLVFHYGTKLNVDRVLDLCRPFGERLLGVLINSVTRYRDREVRLSLGPAIESEGGKFLGAIPEDRLMLSVTVGQIAQHLGARWVLGEERAHELVENFLIGGNIMDWGVTYFGRMENKAVIVRGDRPDLQLAALATPTTCLVLTGGHEPIQYVHHQAEQEEVPLLVVEADTISTAHALDTVLEGSTSYHPRKVERFRDLVREYTDLEAFQRSLFER